MVLFYSLRTCRKSVGITVWTPPKLQHASEHVSQQPSRLCATKLSLSADERESVGESSVTAALQLHQAEILQSSDGHGATNVQRIHRRLH